jgi:hypothetical protein
LATRFEEALRDHATLSDEAVRQADIAYRRLTDDDPPNAAEYASRSVYLVMFTDEYSPSMDESKQRISRRLGDTQHLIDTKFVEDNGEVTVMALVRGAAGVKWLVENLRTKPKMAIHFADLLTHELIRQAKNDLLREFEKHLPAQQR